MTDLGILENRGDDEDDVDGAREVGDGSEDMPPQSVRTHGARVLVVGTHDWAVEQAVVAIEAVGCSALRCHEPGQPSFPCNALIEGRTCPLDAGFDVVATVRARPLGSLAQSEFGVVCALHHGKPLVVAGVAPQRPLGPWAVALVDQGGDLASACESVVHSSEQELAPDPT